MNISEKYNINRNEIDTLADQAIDNIIPPYPLLDMSVWQLLTVAEDRIRMCYVGLFLGDELEIELLVDNMKYSLRHAINHVYKKTINEKISLPSTVRREAYEQASKLLEAAKKYESLSRLISATYSSEGYFIKEDDNYRLEYDSDIRYNVLEGFGHGANIEPDITGVLYHWFRVGADSIEKKIIQKQIHESVRVKKGKVIYPYQGHLACGISEQIPQREFIIPEDFKFPWGSAYKTQMLINSLLVRCFYHVLAIQIAKEKSSLRNGAVSSLLLILTKEQLFSELQMLTDSKDEEIYSFIDTLIYGYKSKTPDIALQPLFQTKSGLLMIPCYHILNSNIQRNILALTAKIDSKYFDSQSSFFEEQMLSTIKLSLKNWPYKILNKEFNINKVKEEIDGLILDEVNKTVVLLECRWILQPGDIREVFNKIQAAASKVKQLSRKVDFVKDNLLEVILRSFGDVIDTASLSDWKVRGIVVIQGFGGTVSEQSDIPIITTDIFCKGLDNFKNLELLYSWVKSLSWLPVKGKHFDVEVVIEDNSLVKVSRDAAILLVDKYQYIKDLQDNIIKHSEI